MRNVLGAAVGSAEAAGSNTPNSVAIKTTIVDKIPLLKTFCTAIRADTSLVEPVTVCIETILDMILVNGQLEMLGQMLCTFPGCYL